MKKYMLKFLKCLASSTISGLIIYILSPVGDMNKPLDAEEVNVYGKRARMILDFEFGTLILLVIHGEDNVAECVLVLGKINL